MKSYIKIIWDTLIHFGITEDLEPREARRISYLNVLVWLTFGYCSTRSMLMLSDPVYGLKLFAIWLAASGGILTLNKFRFFSAAKIYAMVVWISSCSLYSYYFFGGYNNGTYVLLFAVLPMPFILFDIEHRAQILFSMSFILFCFLGLIILQYVQPRPPLANIDIDTVKISITVLTIIIILMSTWYFYSSYSASEAKLAKEKEKSEAANRAKSVFFANMSHELRTPLNVILGFSQLLSRSPNLSGEELASLQSISRSGDHLLALINDVLEFSKIEAGRVELNPEDFDLHDFLLGLEEMFRLKAQKKGLTLKIITHKSVPIHIRVEKNKLRQVLINLLGNAVEFTDQGEIVLLIRVEGDGSACRLSFSVTDTGVGIAAKDQDRIFEAFYQVDDGRSLHQGTGLGLTISDNFVELMGGKLKVESTPDRGSRFSFDLPVEPVEGIGILYPEKGRVIGLAPGEPEYRLLVAEDDPENRTLLLTLLRSIGFSVRTAENGRETIEIWRQWRPHLIWMDIRMPKMDGIEAIREIRGLPGGGRTILIGLTAHAFEEDRKRILEIGGDDFVRKPWTEEMIFSCLEKHLRVCFQYDKDEPLPSDKTHPERLEPTEVAALLADLPEALLSRFVEAVRQSDVAEIEQGIEDISQVVPRLGHFFQKLAADFAYEKIAEYLDKG